MSGSSPQVVAPPARAAAHEIVAQEMLDYIKRHQRIPWREPLMNSRPCSAASGHEYNGTNVLMHLLHDRKRDRAGLPAFDLPAYITFNQANSTKWMENGRERYGGILKGEAGRIVVYYNQRDVGAAGPAPEGKVREAGGESTSQRAEGVPPQAREAPQKRYVMAVSRLWNIEQTSIPKERWAELLPGVLKAESLRGTNTIGDYARVEAMINNCMKDTGLSVQTVKATDAGATYGGYRPQDDMISLLPATGYTSRDHHVSTVLHELAHAACHPKRCNVTVAGPKATLVAELSATLLSHEFGVRSHEKWAGNAESVQTYEALLKQEPKAFMEASGIAVNLTRYLVNFAPPQREVAQEKNVAAAVDAPAAQSSLPEVEEGLRERFGIAAESQTRKPSASRRASR